MVAVAGGFAKENGISRKQKRCWDQRDLHVSLLSSKVYSLSLRLEFTPHAYTTGLLHDLPSHVYTTFRQQMIVTRSVLLVIDAQALFTLRRRTALLIALRNQPFFAT